MLLTEGVTWHESRRNCRREPVCPNGPAGMPGVWYAGLRVMAIDGSTLEMPDEVANAQRFGYLGASRGSSAFPQMRFVAMAECGTHTLCYANPGPYATGELTLAESVIDRADATMLVTADRNFYGYAFWQRSLATGAKLLFRVKCNLRLPREQELADGSYLTTLYACDKDRRQKTNGTVVRVIEYMLDGIPDPEPSYRLITNWFDIHSVLGEIASGRAVSSRGKRNPRGVKRKMSNFNLRKRGDPLNQPCDPTPRMVCI